MKLDEEVEKRQEEAWADELVKQLEREEKVSRVRRPILIPAETDAYFQMRVKLENEKQALVAFVSKFDALGLGGLGLPLIPVSSCTSAFSTHPNGLLEAQTRSLPKCKEPTRSRSVGISRSPKPTGLVRS